MLTKALITFAISMVPVIELRGAIPYGVAAGLDPWLAFGLSVLGNMLPVPFILLFIRKIFAWMKRYEKLGKIVTKLENRASSKSDTVKKYELVGLCILVAIPLPGTGAWTGSLVAALMNIPLRKSGPACVFGVLIAGAVVMAISTGVLAIVT